MEKKRRTMSGAWKWSQCYGLYPVRTASDWLSFMPAIKPNHEHDDIHLNDKSISTHGLSPFRSRNHWQRKSIVQKVFYSARTFFCNLGGLEIGEAEGLWIWYHYSVKWLQFLVYINIFFSQIYWHRLNWESSINNLSFICRCCSYLPRSMQFGMGNFCCCCW